MWGAVIAAAAAAVALTVWFRRGRYRRVTDQPRLNLRWWWAGPAITALTAILTRTDAGTPFTGLAYLVGAVAISLIDLDVHRIPDRFLAGWGCVVALLLVTEALKGPGPSALLRALLGGAALGMLYLLLAIVASMGLGDVKLALLTGSVLGVHSWQAIYLGTLAAFAVAAAAAVLLMATGRSRRQDHLAFGPATVAGALVALALGG